MRFSKKQFAHKEFAMKNIMDYYQKFQISCIKTR